MYKKLLLFLLLASTVFCDIYKIETKNFVIAYEEKMKETAEMLYSEIENIGQAEFDFYGYYPEEKITVAILDNVDYENAFANISSTIVLYPNTPPENLIEKNYENWITYVFAHELTHIIISNSYKGIIEKMWGINKYIHNLFTPNWLHEGLAVYSETRFTNGGRGRSYSFHMKIKEIVNSGKFQGLELAASYDFRGEYAYVLGYSFIEFFVENFGEEKLKKAIIFFMENQYKTAFYAFSKVSEVSEEVLENQWKDWLDHKYQIQNEIVDGEVIDEISGAKKSLRVSGGELYYYDMYEEKFLTKNWNYGIFRLNPKIEESKEKFLPGNIVNGFDIIGEKAYYSLLLPNFFKNKFYAISFSEEKKLLNGNEYLNIGRAVNFVRVRDKIAYVFRRGGKQGLQLLNGNEIINSSENFNFEKLHYFNNKIFFSASKKEIPGSYIYSYDFDNNSIQKIIKGTSPFANDDGIYYTLKDQSGVENVFLKPWDTNKKLKITNVKYGAEEPVILENTLYYLNYEEAGYKIYRLNKNEFVNKEYQIENFPKDKKSKENLKSDLNHELFENNLKFDYGIFTGTGVMFNYTDTFKRQQLMLGAGYQYSSSKEEIQGISFVNYQFKSMGMPIFNIYGEFSDETFGSLNLNIPLFLKRKTAYYFLNGSVNTSKEYSYGASFANVLGYKRYNQEDYSSEINQIYFEAGSIGLRYYWSQEENEIEEYIFPSEVLFLEELELDNMEIKMDTKKAFSGNIKLKYEKIIERGTKDGFIVLKNLNINHKTNYYRWKSEKEYFDIGVFNYSIGMDMKIIYHMEANFNIGLTNVYDFDKKQRSDNMSYIGMRLYF